jgi:hypothetical protein
MTDLIEALHHFDLVLSQSSPKIANRLQPGLSLAEIEARTASFSWKLPPDGIALYRWHNGLSGQPGQLNLVEKLLRLKGKWHGELSGRENEINLQFDHRRIIAKFLPLEYALAGHRHLKLGKCPIDLLPISVVSDGDRTFYCMMRLDSEQPIIYCANGTNLPPMKVTESFLSTQPQFSQLSDLIAFLTVVFEQAKQPSLTEPGKWMDETDAAIDLTLFNQNLQQYLQLKNRA